MSGPAAAEASRGRGLLARGALAALLAAAVAVPFAGCLRGTTFQCASNAECTGSTPGRCEPEGYCSFPDSSCATGNRFGDHSGPRSGQCTGEGAGVDAGIDALPACPGYLPITGVATHRYRVITGAATWSAQRTTCMAEGGYLVEPDDAAELMAVNMLAPAVELWVGVTDQATEMTFLTGRGAPVTFLPWEAAQPDDGPQGGADCVRASPIGSYADDRCNTDRRAVCECDL